jgi:hypothetical protein
VIAAWQTFVATAQSAWPKVRFDEDQLATHVASRLAGNDLAAALAAVPAADLALAAACALQEPTAHAAFDTILAEVDAAGAAVRATPDLVEEV